MTGWPSCPHINEPGNFCRKCGTQLRIRCRAITEDNAICGAVIVLIPDNQKYCGSCGHPVKVD